MTISHKNKFIFVEVGSTGSTAIRKVLNKYRDTVVEVIDGFFFSKDEHNNPSHIPIWALKNELNLESYFKFAFFRNPWEVAVSKFFFHHGNDVVGSHKMPRNERYHRFFSSDFNDWAQQPGFLDMHYESKTKTMWDMVSMKNSLLVDEIYDFKYLNDNWKIICNKIGIQHEILPNTKDPNQNTVGNKSQSQHYSKYYNDKTIEVVREHFAKEIEYFDYKFEDLR